MLIPWRVGSENAFKLPISARHFHEPISTSKLLLGTCLVRGFLCKWMQMEAWQWVIQPRDKNLTKTGPHRHHQHYSISNCGCRICSHDTAGFLSSQVGPSVFHKPGGSGKQKEATRKQKPSQQIVLCNNQCLDDKLHECHINATKTMMK